MRVVGDTGLARLSEAKRQGGLETELRRLSFIPLIVVDEIGYIPFDPEAANLMFSLVSNRYERASMIVTSNKPFCAWGEIFGDDTGASRKRAATIAAPPRPTGSAPRRQSLTLKWPSFRPARPARVGHISTGASGALFDRP
jgi:IstB-like ATP binding protein